MPEEDTVFVEDFCPGCQRKHRVGINRDALKRGLEPGKQVELYCIRTDAKWNMSEREKRTLRKKFAP